MKAPADTGDEAGRDADGQQGQVVDAKRLQHAGESDHGRRDGEAVMAIWEATTAMESGREGECPALGHFGDHRQGWRRRWTGTRPAWSSGR